MPEVSIAQAAALLGTSTDTIRRRIKRGELQAYKASDGHLVVDMPEAASTGHPEASPTSPTPAISEVGAELVRLQAELEHTRAMLDETRRHRDDLQGVIATLKAQLEATQEALQQDAIERAELRRLLGNAQQQVGLLLPAPSNDAEHVQGTAEHTHSSTAQPASGGQGWRRWWPWGRA